MRKISVTKKTSINVNNGYEAKPLEMYLADATTESTPIQVMSPMIYTAREDGVQPQYDIRTDKWVVAQMALGEQSKTAIARRSNSMKEAGIAKGEPTQGIETE